MLKERRGSLQSGRVSSTYDEAAGLSGKPQGDSGSFGRVGGDLTDIRVSIKQGSVQVSPRPYVLVFVVIIQGQLSLASHAYLCLL